MKKLAAVFFRTDANTEPVREWLLSLGKNDRKAIGGDIMTVEFGWPVGMPTCRPMGRGLYEVRSTLPNKRAARVLFCISHDRIVLLHDFVKKDRKTPKQDLDLAYRRKRQVAG